MDLNLLSALSDNTDQLTGTASERTAVAAESDPLSGRRLGVIGAGRLGTAITAALHGVGVDATGPLVRGADGAGCDVILLCVPDGEIASAAALLRPGRLVGHCSGATGLDVLCAHRHEAFSLHPLMTVTAAGARFDGAAAAVAGSSEAALDLACALAVRLGMVPVDVAPADRPAYHAAASIASNFLVTLEAAAERLALSAGVQRQLLVPLVRASVENWAALGGADALTGPVARGDDRTVAAQRHAVAERAADLLPLFDALVDATRNLVVGPRVRGS
ncbi:MAG: DUF2520 domain-containing protein [Solirubrobacteraceae bacterium]